MLRLSVMYGHGLGRKAADQCTYYQTAIKDKCNLKY